MVKMSQHSASAGSLVKLRMWKFYLWLIMSGFTRDIFCADTANRKQIEAQTFSTSSSNDETSETQSNTDESSLDALFGDLKSDYDDRNRMSRAIPSEKNSNKSPPAKNHRKQEYILKIPLSVLRQYELYRILRWQDEEMGNLKKRNSIIPVPRYGRSNNDNMEDVNDIFQLLGFEKDNFKDGYQNELLQEENGNYLPLNGNKRSMLLLSSPKSEETTKEKTGQTFVLPYPRPGRSNKQLKMGNTKNEHLILPYITPGSSKMQKQLSNILSINSKRYILPTARAGRSFSDSSFDNEKDSLIIENWLSSTKPIPLTEKINKQILSDIDENEGSFFVIPYPRPGKKSMFKLKNKNRESNNSGKEITDYVLPYPRPGKKSGREQTAKVLRIKNTGTKNIDSQNLILPYPRPGRAGESSFLTADTYDLSDILNTNENLESDNIIEYNSNDIMPSLDLEHLLKLPSKKFENKYILPYLRTGRSFKNVVPYPRPGRSIPLEVESVQFSNELFSDSDVFQLLPSALKNFEVHTSDNLRSKRSASVVPYPVLGPFNVRSNAVVPYPRFGRSNSVVPYPRLGRSSPVVPYPRFGRSNSVVPYPRLGRSKSAVYYPRIRRSKRSSTVVPLPRLGRSDSLVPYPRPGRSDAVVPYPRPGRSDYIVSYPRYGREESFAPYPRPGRAESVVPYPRLGRAESLVPYPRPGRAESVVPYPRPGRAESVVPYPRAESVVPYPRPGRAESVVPYPRLGRSLTEKTDFIDTKDKMENWLHPYHTQDNSNSKQEDISSFRDNLSANFRFESFEDKDNSQNIDTASNFLSERNPFNRHDRAENGQGYILPHPRIGRSAVKEQKKRESINTDTVIPYPRLGRSEKEINQEKSDQDSQNSVHKLNKHMLTSVEDSVYLLPYPRPGRYAELLDTEM